MRAGQKPDYAGSREPAPVVKETRQAHSVRFLLDAAGYSAAATLVFMLLAKGARGVRPCQARTSAASQQALKGSLR